MAFRLRNFHAAVQGASGPEFEVMDYLQTTSSLAFERVLALNFTLRVCRSISCTADRKQANASCERTGRVVRERIKAPQGARLLPLPLLPKQFDRTRPMPGVMPLTYSQRNHRSMIFTVNTVPQLR